jgi:hypothetical protein
MLQRMAAEAIAAQIAEKVFGTGVGGGGGWLGTAAGILGGLAGGGRMSGLSEIAITAQKIPGFADGGFLRPGQVGIVGEQGPEMAFGGRSGMTIEPMAKGATSVTINQAITISAPTGSVSRATQEQIALQAARGASRAMQRSG